MVHLVSAGCSFFRFVRYCTSAFVLKVVGSLWINFAALLLPVNTTLNFLYWIKMEMLFFNKNANAVIYVKLATKFLRFLWKYSKIFLKFLEVSILRVYKWSVNTSRMIIKSSIWTLIMNWKWIFLVERFECFYFMNSVWVTKQRKQLTTYAARWARMYSLFVRHNISSIGLGTIT